MNLSKRTRVLAIISLGLILLGTFLILLIGATQQPTHYREGVGGSDPVAGVPTTSRSVAPEPTGSAAHLGACIGRNVSVCM